MPGRMRERYAAELAKLRGHSRAALKKWAELQASNEGSWHQWVSDMDRARDTYIHAFHFRSRLRHGRWQGAA